MVRPQVAAGENGPQKWRVTVCIFNKQWRMSDKESSSGLGEGHSQNGDEPSGSMK